MTWRRCFNLYVRVARCSLPKSLLDRSSRGFASSVRSSEDALRRSALFKEEKKRQREAVGRIEKINVKVMSNFGNEHLVMNKDLSTPLDCARHISEHLSQKSVVAMLDSGQPWDMHRPLSESCELQFLSTSDKNPGISNMTFWRSCSFMLGAVVSEAFREDIPVILHSFPSPNVFSGSFALDAYIGLDSWIPSQEELRSLSGGMIKLSQKELPFERLSVSEEIAAQMFSDNPYKLNHISKIFEKYKEVVVYRLGDHLDISRGPMMNHSGLLGRCTIASVHHLKDDQLFRFQGVALPVGHKLNHYAYGILESRAKYLNEHMLPSHASNTFQPAFEYATEAQEIQHGRQS